MKPNYLLSLLILFFSMLLHDAFAQCCAGGGSCPIAGGASAGVLQEKQFELNVNHQYTSSRKFLTGDRDTIDFLDRYWSNYMYMRLAYGVTKDLTMSVETGYYLNKTQKGIDAEFNGEIIPGELNESKGIADLIIFPRYDIVNRVTPTSRVEVTLGLGLKIPLGSYSDSTFSGNYFYNTNIPIYYISPLAVQPTNGANDFIFYNFVYKGYPLKNFRLFMSSMYIMKGTSPLGVHFGDYASVGLYAGKTFFEKLGVTLQLKGEWIDKIKPENEFVDLQAYYNVDHYATGSKKILLVPQLSYSFGNLTLFASSEFPLYQYVNRTQIASQHSYTTGISWKFKPFKEKSGTGVYCCPMHPERTGKAGDKCPDCKMDLEPKK